MNKKTGLQAIMVFVIILISLWFYLKYFTENYKDVKKTLAIEKVDENQNSMKITTGIITDGQIRRVNAMSNNLQDLSVKKVMTKNPVSINQDTLAEKALSIMNAKKITSLCVHKDKNKKKTVGILHIHNILQSNIH